MPIYDSLMVSPLQESITADFKRTLAGIMLSVDYSLYEENNVKNEIYEH